MPVMRIISVEELVGVMSNQAIIDLTDDYGTGVVVQATLDAAEMAAIADLERYAARYYALPLPAVAGVKALVLQLTKCHLYMRRQAVPEEVTKLYDQMLRQLKDLTPASLGIPGVEPVAGVAASGISVSAPGQRFGENFMQNEY